jgi:hypothetical protein
MCVQTGYPELIHATTSITRRSATVSSLTWVPVAFERWSNMDASARYDIGDKVRYVDDPTDVGTVVDLVPFGKDGRVTHYQYVVDFPVNDKGEPDTFTEGQLQSV